uniref:Uncharacterized protein n=1 Tax=Oryza punctata TaxID=4537 RepID=A0A0E0LRH8_ORYPU
MSTYYYTLLQQHILLNTGLHYHRGCGYRAPMVNPTITVTSGTNPPSNVVSTPEAEFVANLDVSCCGGGGSATERWSDLLLRRGEGATLAAGLASHYRDDIGDAERWIELPA